MDETAQAPLTTAATANGDYAEWYASVRHRLSGSGLWLCGDEPGRMDADTAAKCDYRVLLTRLSPWEDTVESFTHRLLYQIVRALPGVYPDFAFLPPRADQALFDEARVPWLIGIHSKKPALSFDAIGISNSIVQELVNLAPLLEKSGIPLKKSERMARPEIPLVILGGANAIHTSILMVPEPPVDVIFAGEDVEKVREVFATAAEGKRKGLSKLQVIAELVKIEGCIAPDAPAATGKHHSETPATARLMIGAPLPLSADTAGSGTIQISEGCRSFCSFCSESYVRKPYRDENAGALFEAAKEMKKAQGLSKIDLFSFNYASHGDFYALVEKLLEITPGIGLKSQRMDTIAGDPRLLPLMHALGKSSLTFGIEGISSRLRSYLHKNLPDATLRRALEIVMSAPVREVKLFFILTGLEDASDFAELADLAALVKSLGQRVGRGPRVVFSATALVRFPWTPLEWEEAPSMKAVAKLAEEFDAMVSRSGYEARMAAPPEEYWISQVIARARRPEIWQALVAAQKKTGFTYCQMLTHSFHTAFREALSAAGVDPDTCAAPAAFDDDNVPWALLGSGLSRPFLRKKAEEARHFHEAPSHPIAKAAAVVHGVYVPPHEKAKARIEAWRKSGIEVPVGVRLSPAMKGLPRSVLAALLASAIMSEWSELAAGYAGYAGSIWKDWETPSVTGIDCFRLRFAFGTAAILTAKLADPAARAQLSARLAPRMEVLERALSADDSVRLSFSSPFKFEGVAWCAANHIKFTLRKPEKTLSVYDFAPQSKKKATVADLSCREEGGRFVVNLAARPGFDVKGFLHSAFALPVREDFFRVDVVAS